MTIAPTTAGTPNARGSLDPIMVRECADAAAWQAFLKGRDQVLFHRWEWSEAFATYGLTVRRFAAYEGERIIGVLPLVRQQSRLFGDQFVSLPWFDCVGVLAENGTTALSVAHHVSGMVHEHPRAVLQIRQAEPLDLQSVCRQDKVLMRLRLPSTPDELWTSLKPKVRNQVRKAEKSGLTATLGGSELLDDFFRVYVHNMRDLGSPSHARGFFHRVGAVFPEELRIAVVRLDREVIGAGLTLRNGSALEIPWASSLRNYNRFCVNHLMYWRLLSYAIEEGYQWFHFGRSTVGSGTYNFKKQWNAEPRQLYWYYLCGQAEQAARLARPTNEEFSTAQKAWARLPVAVTSVLGPRIIAKVP